MDNKLAIAIRKARASLLAKDGGKPKPKITAALDALDEAEGLIDISDPEPVSDDEALDWPLEDCGCPPGAVSPLEGKGILTGRHLLDTKAQHRKGVEPRFWISAFQGVARWFARQR